MFKQKVVTTDDSDDEQPIVVQKKLEDSDSEDDEPIIKPEPESAPLNDPSTSAASVPDDLDDRPVFEHRRTIRDDSVYESLDYEICENTLLLESEKKISPRFSLRKDIARWITFIQIGIITAFIACTIDVVIGELSAYKYQVLKNLVDKNVMYGDLVFPYLTWVAISAAAVLPGALLVTYVEPVAKGSGIPIVKSYLNGIKVPRIVRIKTLAVKCFGVVSAVIGGLAGGKEGPMIHAGAIVAAGISQGKSTTFVKDFRVFRYFRDDHEKRDFVLGGAAAGVTAAFGAPIGGVLFSLEEAASFWNQNLIWRTLVASAISSFTLNVILSAYHGLESLTYIGLFNLGKFDEITFEYYEIPIFVCMGVLGGILGALWNALNTRLNLFRKKYIKQNWAKVVEVALGSLITVTVGCVMMYLINDCRPLGNDPTPYPVQLFCEDNEYNAVVSLWFQTPEASVKSLFHDPPGSHKILTLAVFTISYFLLSCATYGLNVSLGIFIPTVLVGASWGRLLALCGFDLFPHAKFLDPGKYALMGAAAQLGGILRMTISLTVILMETTGVNAWFTFPLVVTLMSAKWIGDLFNEGIYDTTIKMSRIPMLPWHPPHELKGKTASDIMSRPAICFKLREKASYVLYVLKNCNHNGFPIVEDVQGNNRSHGRICGTILRSQLVVILLNSLYEEKKRHWKNMVSIETFRDVYPRYPSVNDVRIHDDKIDYTINFDIFMNPSPSRVNEMDTVSRIFRTFRALGLRHMLVIDKENRVKGIITRKDFLYKES